MFLNQPPHSQQRCLTFEAEKFIQIPFSAFTLLLKSETKNIFSGIDFSFYSLVVSKNVSFRGPEG